ncbi:MAG TPA: VOC family protein [Candidatus Saccharimonadales bacterium]|nr:VOC family protein [Candidatus Saccharimonadales bacterium]
MKMNSVSGLVFYVKDTAKTADFYDKLGFHFEKREPDHLSVRLNWFWMDFHPQDKEDKPEFQKEANLENKGAGLFIYVSVDDVDEFYEGLKAKGLKPSSEPRDWPWGNREFVIRDPDGYKLVFFKRNKK